MLGVIILGYPETPNIEYFMMANILLILVILTIHGLKIFIDKPNHNNQLEQTKSDVRQLFTRLNDENRRKGKNFEWVCPDDFMYLEVHF